MLLALWMQQHTVVPLGWKALEGNEIEPVGRDVRTCGYMSIDKQSNVAHKMQTQDMKCCLVLRLLAMCDTKKGCVSVISTTNLKATRLGLKAIGRKSWQTVWRTGSLAVCLRLRRWTRHSLAFNRQKLQHIFNAWLVENYEDGEMKFFSPAEEFHFHFHFHIRFYCHFSAVCVFFFFVGSKVM